MSAVLLVEDGNSPYVLAAVRSLGRAGHRVGMASPRPNSRVASSRFARRWHPLRLPEKDLDGFLADVRAAVRDGGYEVVFGADDIEVLALSPHRASLGALFPYPAHDTVLRAVDKLGLSEAAKAVGMASPATRIATPEGMAVAEHPVVVKARMHWTPEAPYAAQRHVSVRLCRDPAETAARVREIEASSGRALLQQPIDGVQLALSVVVDHAGVVRAVCQQETLMSSLVQTSTRARTVPVDSGLVEQAEALLRELGWFGLANLQFLRPQGGAPHVIDLNGRFYGSLELAIAAGADLPAVWADLALGGGGPATPQQARPDVRFHALHTDLVRARAHRAGGLVADVSDTLRFAWGAAHSTWSVRDPKPALSLAAGMASRAARRLRAG